MFRKKGSPYWWIKYRDASGRTIEQSTQTADRAKAALVESEKRAAIWHETQRKNHRRLKAVRLTDGLAGKT